MPRPPKNPNDPRSRYTHTAYDATFGGIPQERGPSGRDTLLSGTYRAAFQFVLPDAGVTGPQLVGDLPLGLWIDGVVNHVELTSGTMRLDLRGVGGGSDHTLVAAIDGDLTEVGEWDVEPIYTPLANSRPVYATITGGTPGERVVASILATPAETGWK